MDKLPLISQLIGPLTDLLKLLTGVMHSYGLAIIIFTILVKAVLAPLNLRQLHSARRMSALAPRIKELQQKYKGNREELTKAQMALYKEEGANPASGCLPLLIQMPVLYSLFFVFRDLAKTLPYGADAIYHQPFLWFHLDKPDSLFGAFIFPHSAWGPLPIMAALLQWVQQRMMMMPVSDPQQRSTQQIMQFMPLMILVFATNYPAGLALYWVTSTAFAIVLQYFVTGWGQLFSSPFKIPEAPAPPPSRGPSGPPAKGSSTPSPRPSGGLLSGLLGLGGRGSANGSAPVENGTAPTVVENGTAPTVKEIARPRSTPATDDDGQATTEDANGARLGKMQRAAMRSPKARPRTSKGAKR